MTLERWKGGTAVVTGAAGGLGSGFARALAAAGAGRLVLTDVKQGPLDELAAEVGDVATTAVVDVRDYDAVAALAESTGPCDLLVNNAGIEHVGHVWEEPPEAWHRVVDINLNGVYHGIRAFVPGMIEARRRATVFNLASVAALVTGGEHAVYEVTKHAVLALSEALADGLRTTGSDVQVSVALPGPVRTRIYADAGGSGTEQLQTSRALLEDQGMPPDEAAATMLEQVAAGAFAVTPHPDWVRPMAAARAERLRSLLDT